MRSAMPGTLCHSLLATVLLSLLSTNVSAVPSFARQTQLDCTVCHVSWPELTPAGRQFKLNAYTLGERQTLPLAGMLQISRTSSKRVEPEVPDAFPKDRDGVVQQASVFLSGKLTDHIGGFTQWSYDGVEHHSSIDNLDWRYANRIPVAGQSMIYGFTLHNNPMVQDVYNTGPTWGFPFASSSVSVAPNAATMMEGLGQQVVGLGSYALWGNTLYGEVSLYRTADKGFSFLRAGTDRSQDAALKGVNPYWRLALQHEWSEGMHSAMLGAYGMTVHRYPDNRLASGAADRYRDDGFDGQYQYITDAHRFSVQFNTLHEKQDWLASVQSNPSDELRTTRFRGGYYYQKKYGMSLAYFSTTGSRDDILSNSGDPVTGSLYGSPATTGYIAELDYLPKRDIRFALQYTGYTKFNGAGANYDGFGRNARDNNTLHLLAWFMF